MNNPWVFNFQSYQRQSKQSVPLLQKMVDAQAHQGKKSYYKTRRMSEDIPILHSPPYPQTIPKPMQQICQTPKENQDLPLG